MKRKTDNFDKFYNRKNNASVKEKFKQEKRAEKKDRREIIDKHFEEKRNQRAAQQDAAQAAKPLPGAKKILIGKQSPGSEPAPDIKREPLGDQIPLNKY